MACQIVNGLWERYYASSHTYVKGDDLVTLSNHALTSLSLSVISLTGDNIEQGRATKHYTWTLSASCAVHQIKCVCVLFMRGN